MCHHPAASMWSEVRVQYVKISFVVVHVWPAERRSIAAFHIAYSWGGFITVRIITTIAIQPVSIPTDDMPWRTPSHTEQCETWWSWEGYGTALWRPTPFSTQPAHWSSCSKCKKCNYLNSVKVFRSKSVISATVRDLEGDNVPTLFVPEGYCNKWFCHLERLNTLFWHTSTSMKRQAHVQNTKPTCW